jgi:murein hydrolase activator
MHWTNRQSADSSFEVTRLRGREVRTSKPRDLVTSKPFRLAAALIVVLSMTLADAQIVKDSDLERVRGEIARLKSRLDDVRREKQSAQREFEEVSLELEIRTHELTLATDMAAKLAAERLAIEGQIASLTPRIAAQKKALGRRLASVYRFGGLTYLRMLMTIDQQRDPIEALSMLSYLVSRDARLVSHFQAMQQQLAARNAELADRQQRLEAMRRVVEERRAAVATARAQKEQLLVSLRSQESGSQQRLAELEEKARRLERLINLLSQQEAGGAVAQDIRAFQGALAWPVEGKVVERFGRQRDPKFDTLTNNNGLKIAAAAGLPVKAVFQGTVLFSQWFKGYGNLIILDHGNRVFSLYGNLKSSNVAVGEHVAAGQAIAGVGESEDSPPGFLYFEIRQDNRPEDPQKWLR